MLKYFLDQKPFCPFLENKKNSLFRAIVLLSKRKVIANFIKKYSFLRSLWIFESENFARMSRARGQNHRFFVIRLKKIYLIGCIIPVFKNLKKSSLFFHPLCRGNAH